MVAARELAVRGGFAERDYLLLIWSRIVRVEDCIREASFLVLGRFASKQAGNERLGISPDALDKNRDPVIRVGRR